MGIADPNEFVVGPGAAPAGKPPIGPVSINCGCVSKIEMTMILEFGKTSTHQIIIDSILYSYPDPA